MGSRLVRNSVFGTIAALSSTLGSFLSALIVARTLGVGGVGTYSFAIWIVALVTTVTGGGLPFTLTRYLPELLGGTQARAPNRFAAFLMRPSLAFNLVPVTLAAAYAVWLARAGETASDKGPFGDPLLCLLIGLCCTTQALADFTKAYLRGIHALDRVARLTSIGVVAQLVVTGIGSLCFGVHGALIGYLLGVALPCLPYRDFWRDRPEASPDLRRRLVRYAKFRWASEIASAFVFSRIEVFFLQVFWGVTSIGLLTASLTLANLAIQGPLMMTWGLLPHFSEQVGRSDTGSLRKSYAMGTRLMGFMVFPACFGLAAIVPELLPLLYGQAFAGAVPSAVILVCAASVSATATVGANMVWALERSDVDFYLGLVGAVLSIAGGLLIIAPYGVMGAACSRAMTQFVVIGLGTWFLSRRLGFTVPFGSLARLLCAALLCAGAARTCLILWSGPGGLVGAVLVGATVYLLAVRILGGLEDEDVAALRGLMTHVPRPAGGIARRLVHLALG